MNIPYKVVILAAGKGTRNTTYDGLHKALYPIADKPAISYTIDNVPKDIEIVVALGYRGPQVRAALKYLYPDRHFTFVTIDNYDQKGSGPGYSLLQCAEYLQCPFIWTPVDSFFSTRTKLFEQAPTNDWVGTKSMYGDLSKYCSYNHLNGSLYYSKEQFHGTAHIFIGTAGVVDYKSFWENLRSSKNNMHNNELQVKEGFINKVDSKTEVAWHDIGNNDGYEKICYRYPSQYSIAKRGQAVIIHNDKVIKWFQDTETAGRIDLRSAALIDIVPESTLISADMIGYKYVEGDMLSECLSLKVFQKFLQWFVSRMLDNAKNLPYVFNDTPRAIHSKKLNDRIKPFIDSNLDNIQTINGIAVPPIKELIKQIDWAVIESTDILCHFHGDPQLENVIYKDDGKFTLIDWRPAPFIADLYYDMAKIYHSLLINGKVVRDKLFSTNIKEDRADVEYVIRNNLLDFANAFKVIAINNKLDWNKIVLLGILQYLHIASLYLETDKNYSTFLFLLGKMELYKFFSEEYSCTIN